MWIQDTILKKKKFTRSDILIRKSYFVADVQNDFTLGPPAHSQKKLFISDINESFRVSRDSRLESLHNELFPTTENNLSSGERNNLLSNKNVRNDTINPNAL